MPEPHTQIVKLNEFNQPEVNIPIITVGDSQCPTPVIRKSINYN